MLRRIAKDNTQAMQLESVSANSQYEIERRLRQRRSSKYIEAMTGLDAESHVISEAVAEQIINAIKQELPEISFEHQPVGIVARCYLEPPYEVHCLDKEGAIIKHYKSYDDLPPLLEKARTIALHKDYAFVEVYYDCIIAVKHDGNVAVISQI